MVETIKKNVALSNINCSIPTKHIVIIAQPEVNEYIFWPWINVNFYRVFMFKTRTQCGVVSSGSSPVQKTNYFHNIIRNFSIKTEQE
jgi:hypothetical protein